MIRSLASIPSTAIWARFAPLSSKGLAFPRDRFHIATLYFFSRNRAARAVPMALRPSMLIDDILIRLLEGRLTWLLNVLRETRLDLYVRSVLCRSILVPICLAAKTCFEITADISRILQISRRMPSALTHFLVFPI